MKKVFNFNTIFTKIITILLFVGIVFIYKYISDNKLFNPTMFPSLDRVVNDFKGDISLELTNMISSFKLLVPSIIIMAMIALILGSIVGRNEIARNILNPVIYAFSCVQAILMIPFLRVMIKGDFWQTIVMIVYHIVWATLFSTITGIQSIDKRYLETSSTLKIDGIKKYLKVIFPAASPAILGGFVNSLRASFAMLLFAEMYGARNGMGFYVGKYTRLGIYSRMWGGLVFIIIILIIVMMVFEKIKDYILRWTIDER